MAADTLRLECDNLVIGGGIAGLVSALRLPGHTLVATASLGATAVSGGVFDLPEERDTPAEKWFLEIMRDTACPYVEGRCLTDMRAQRSGMVPEITHYAGAPIFVSLDGTPLDGAIVPAVKQFSGRSGQEIAHLLESDEAGLDALGEALAGAGAESYMLPPVLGIRRTPGIRARLERMAGAKVYEYVTAPSAHGLRLLHALREAADRNPKITVLEMTRITSVGAGAIGYTGTKAKRAVAVRASNLVIATGGPMTGFQVDGDRLYEPLTGITVADLDKDVSVRFSSDHPLMFKGTGTILPAIGGFANARAAGATAAGFGLYAALRTGYHAGDGL